ncbi:MAG: hypothetical protein M3N27_05470, partial [Thermoproteota archaeon]|nr:hypothetical protein [Thermoproteota archaeon]
MKNFTDLKINLDTTNGEIRLSKTNKKLDVPVCLVSLGNLFMKIIVFSASLFVGIAVCLLQTHLQIFYPITVSIFAS